MQTQFLFGRNIFEVDHIVDLARDESHLHARHFVDNLLGVQLGYLALELDQLVHLKGQRLLSVSSLGRQEDNIHQRYGLLTLVEQEIIETAPLDYRVILFLRFFYGNDSFLRESG